MDKGIILASPLGMVFGVAAHLSGVSSPQAIRGQFIFEKEIMMKMFLGGLAGSSLSLAVLSAFYSDQFDKTRDARGWGDKGAISAILGGFIQGSGMAIGGSCPGMAFAQLGAGLYSAPALYLGGVVGASLYGYMHPWLKEHHVFDFAKTLEGKFESMHLERVFFGGRFIPTAMVFGALTLGTALAFESQVPWRADVSDLNVDQANALNPTIAGLIIGGLQIPTYMLLNTFLGASSGYSVMSSQILRLVPEEFILQYSYAKNFIKSKASWQVGLGVGIMAGAALVSGFGQRVLTSISDGIIPASSSAPHVPPLQAFVGGLMIVFGARFVGGCASGHGLSGLPSLHVVSWITVPSMFLGGIVTGTIMNHVFGNAEYMLRM